MSRNRLEEIEKIKEEIPEIKITPTFNQSILISIGFYGLAIFVSYLAETV